MAGCNSDVISQNIDGNAFGHFDLNSATLPKLHNLEEKIDLSEIPAERRND